MYVIYYHLHVSKILATITQTKIIHLHYIHSCIFGLVGLFPCTYNTTLIFKVRGK